VLVDGSPALPREEIAGLLRRDGEFDRNMMRAGIRFFFLPAIRRQLGREIRAQFEAFRATGLPLDHVNAHKHMHLHPTIADLVIEIGRDFGMKAVRVPSEPVAVLRRAFPNEHPSIPFYGLWAERLRWRLKRAGLFVNDHLFGLAWTGRMDEERLLRLVPHLPDGVSEIYLHPATGLTTTLARAAPGYRHEDEFAALLSSSVKRRICDSGIQRVSYSDFSTP
jgi:hopanoid biosynthesis associated protein HpnK